jgi:hypothetical protein
MRQKSPASAGMMIFKNSNMLETPNDIAGIVNMLLPGSATTERNNVNEYSRMPIFAIDIGRNSMHTYASTEIIIPSENDTSTNVLIKNDA